MQIFTVFDRNRKKKGQMNFEDFIKSINVFHPDTPLNDKIDFSFRMYDLNNNGVIDREEVRQMLTTYQMAEASENIPGGTTIDNIIEETFLGADLNKDGVIDHDEWRAFVTKDPTVIKYMTLLHLKKATTIFPVVYGNKEGSWFTNFERYDMGGFSMAARRAKQDMEDYAQVDVGNNCLFVGIYDGRGGNNSAVFLSNVILQQLSRRIHQNNDVMSYDVLREAIDVTQKLLVRQQNLSSNTSRSSYLTSLVWKGILYIANFGDSRLLIGTEIGKTSVLKVEQLTSDQNLKLKIHSRVIRDDDRCLILASSGFWKIMKNEETMLIVERKSKHGIARRLLEKALEKVAAKNKITLTQLLDSDDREQYHDDITVIVVFINQGKSLWKRNIPIPKVSYRSPCSRSVPLKSILAIDVTHASTEEPVKKALDERSRGTNRTIVIKEPSSSSVAIKPAEVVGKGKGELPPLPVKKPKPRVDLPTGEGCSSTNTG